MRVRRLRVRNIEDLRLATGGDREFRPVQMGPRDVSGELALTKAGGLTLTYGSFSCDIHVSGTWSKDKLTIGALLAAEDVHVFGKSARPGDLVVAGKGKEIDSRYRNRLEYAVINVDKSDVLDVAEANDWRIDPGLLDGADLRIRPIAERLRGGTLEAMGPAAGQALADDLLLEFTRSLSDPGSCSIPGWPHDFLPGLVQRTEEWLTDDLCRPHGVRQLSRHIGVSPRQLYRSFHAAVGMSPAKYLKRYRMTQARLELLEADPAETTVTDVAVSWGFWELGRFAVEYRRLFGECPSATLRAPARDHGPLRPSCRPAS
ncbi:MAG: helix-turn-helix domain-containing protein [Planctomycetota bacterium]|jgi:AraC family ethanolamine operon transcriptional activator